MTRIGLVVLLLTCEPLWAEDWVAEILTGSARSFGSTLRLEQAGFEAILDARWSTRPFEGAPYYAWRVSHFRHSSGWQLQLLHHKISLRDSVPEVERFEVTHGLNQLTLGRVWGRQGWLLRAAAGVVIAHPESRVRGREWSGKGGLLSAGYFFTGPAAEVALGRRLSLGPRAFLTGEAKFTVARIRVPIEGGRASTSNAAVHGLLGFGVVF